MAEDSSSDEWVDAKSDIETESVASSDQDTENVKQNEEIIVSSPNSADENKLSFKLGEDYNSPVYIQRYQTVAEIIGSPIPGTQTNIRRVVDFGSAELNFFKYLKNIPSLSEILLVDLDRSLLEMACGKTRPLAFDYLHRRKKQLTVRVFAGSVAEEDERLLGVDAVTCIELIEHLNEDVLQKLPIVIFGFIQPKLVAITTPNAEFNILFPDSTGFRHWDHKFEWTRLQFRKWCLAVVDKFPQYTFTVSGIGEGPPGSEHLGCCSQLALFVNQNSCIERRKNTSCTPYNLIAEHTYPGEVKKKRNAMEQAILMAEYYVHMLGKYLVDTEAAEEDTVQLPLAKILEFPQMSQYSCDEKLLGKLLSDKGWEISEVDGLLSLLYKYEEEENSEDEEEDHSGEDDKEPSIFLEKIGGITLGRVCSEITAAGDCLEDWDAI